MTVSEKCAAKDRSKCRFHGALDHARMNVAEKKEKYEAATVARDAVTVAGEKDNSPAKSLQVKRAETALNKAQAQLDAIPSEYKKLKETVAARAESDDAEKLEIRLARATKIHVANKEEEKRTKQLSLQAAQKQKDFQKIKAEKEAEVDSNEWKAGYKKAVSAVIVETGEIVSSHTVNIYDSPVTNWEKTQHLRDCGALDIRNIEEKASTEWHYPTIGEGAQPYEQYRVCADATCNCGKIVKEQIEVKDTFNSLLTSVLRF